MMSKENYLWLLQSNLKNIPPEEAANIIQYYREYFEEAGEENVQKVIAELGPPQQLAKRVSADYVMRGMEANGTRGQNVKSAISNTWLIVLAVCCSPIWFPLAIVFAVLLFALVIVIFALLFSLVVVAAAFSVSGIVALVTGGVALFTHVPTGLLTMGAGLLMTGFGILLLIAMVRLIILAKQGFLAIARKCIRGRKTEYDSRSSAGNTSEWR